MKPETLLPSHFLDKMSPADRKAYAQSIGHPAAGWTASETREKAKTRAERDLQKQVGSYLRMLGVEFINPAMNKRSPLPVGWPDFTFAYKGLPVAMECKVAGEKPRPEQNERMDAMRRNGWLVFVVHELADAQNALRAIKLTQRIP